MDSTPEEPVEDTVEERNVNFIKELEWLINKYSMENGSDTPDFILAEYMFSCLQAFNSTVSRRSAWFGIKHFPTRIEKFIDVEDEKKTADEWLAHPDYAGLKILDPDGWDRQNFEVSWAESITKDEFILRMCRSTCDLGKTFDEKKLIS